MVMLKAFKALRPDEHLVGKIAALPYDTMNTDEARKIVQSNPYSYLRIDRAEIDLHPDIDIHDIKVYEKAKSNLNLFKKNGYLKEEAEKIYIYRQIMDERIQIGLVACIAVEDSLNGKIKIHEHTKPDKVEDRTKHIDYCQAHTGTILLTYHNNNRIDKIIGEQTSKMPLYDFTTEDNIRHTIWTLDNDSTIKIQILFRDTVDALYIADGHHRSKSAIDYSQKMKKIDPDYSINSEYNYYPAMIAPDNQLYVMDYNRLVSDLNGLEKKEFLEKIGEKFYIYPQDEPYKPNKKYTFGMYLDKKWYALEYIDNDRTQDDVIKNLDVSILHDNLIEPVLGISMPQKDQRIDFIGGIRGLAEIERRVDKIEKETKKLAVGFSLYPTKIDELMRVADAGKIMPAKSTWFEPKVRCGLFVHEF